MRFLFASIQTFESDFDGRVGSELTRLGNEVEHVTVSHRSSRRLRGHGYSARSVLDLIDELPPFEVHGEARRIEEQYGLSTIREAYRADPPSAGASEAWCIRRTVQYFLALERLFDDVKPDVLVPEVGTELLRTVAHHVALERAIPTFFLFYTIFPDPLRLYVDTMHAPIVAPDEVRELTPEERAEVESFISAFTSRRLPIRAHRRVSPTRERLRNAVEYYRARIGEDRDNQYLLPVHWSLEHVRGWSRAAAARPFYREPHPERPFVYFPLHDTEDYKIKVVIPQFADQAMIVEQIADSLPPGYDLVLKEHPQSIGRSLGYLLRRLRRRPNVRLVDPHASTHDLIEQASAVAVISSTVGLESLLYSKPVLTLGRPFYASQGVTIDVDTLLELRQAIPELLHFKPDREQILRFLHAAMRRCRPGVPVMVDRSDENAVVLAGTLDEAARELAAPETAFLRVVGRS